MLLKCWHQEFYPPTETIPTQTLEYEAVLCQYGICTLNNDGDDDDCCNIFDILAMGMITRI